jgi:peptidoglycan/LPS O-acetylase OafA/YrhL
MSISQRFFEIMAVELIMANSKRVNYIDGLRGVAIINVVLFHAFSRWTSIEPFEQSRFFTKIFQTSWLGVELFFIISGYVIFLTIRGKTLNKFISSRWLRLAPAMIVSSLIIYLTAFLFPDRPAGPADLIDLLPSLTFIEPGILDNFISAQINLLDGALWSIFVEIKFYAWAGVAYFFLKDKQLYSVSFCFFAYLILEIVLKFHNSLFVDALDWFFSIMSFKYFGWFAIGISTLNYFEKRKRTDLLLVIILAITNYLLVANNNYSMELTISVLVLFTLWFLPKYFALFASILESKILLFFGFISYPLYLLHQNIVTGMAIKFYYLGIRVPVILLPLIPIVIVVFISYFVARSEPGLKGVLKRFLVSLRITK